MGAEAPLASRGTVLRARARTMQRWFRPGRLPNFAAWSQTTKSARPLSRSSSAGTTKASAVPATSILWVRFSSSPTRSRCALPELRPGLLPGPVHEATARALGGSALLSGALLRYDGRLVRRRAASSPAASHARHPRSGDPPLAGVPSGLRDSSRQVLGQAGLGRSAGEEREGPARPAATDDSGSG